MKQFILLIILSQTLIGYSQSELAKTVMAALESDTTHWNFELIAEKVVPTDSNESILVLPYYTFNDESSFSLTIWLVRVDNRDGTIKNKTFLLDWSDAIVLTKFTIDTAPYQITPKTRAFGLRTLYRGSSAPNPYSSETITLFIDEKDSFKTVLENFEVNMFQGEWDTNCTGEFTEHSKILILRKKITGGYFDILVKNKLVETSSFIDELGECDSTPTSKVVKTKLQFKEGKYHEIL